MIILINLLVIITSISTSEPYTKDVQGNLYLEITTDSTSEIFFHPGGVHRPPLELPGWPKQLETGALGVCLADVNGNGDLEILVGTNGGKFHVWDYQGNYLPGWPRINLGNINCKAVTADIDTAYPGLEISTATFGNDCFLYVWHSDGADVAGWPYPLGETGSLISPVIFDIDNDGDLEIMLGQRDYPNGWVQVFNHDGSVYPGWPQTLDYMCAATTAVGDSDNNGNIEICALSGRSIYLWDKDGNLKTGWPIGDTTWRHSYAQPVLADVDGDADLEILHAYNLAPPSEIQNYVGIYHHNGTNLLNWPQQFPGPQTYTMPVVGDIDNDGDLEIFGGGHRIGSPCLLARHHTGDAVSGWPVVVDAMESSPIVIDLGIDIANDNGRREVFINDNNHWFYAYNDDGSLVPPWPIRTAAGFPNSASAGDVDGDGDVEIALVVGSKVHIWTFDNVLYRPYMTEWGTWFHDNWNTGWFHPIAPQNLNAQSTPIHIHLTWDANTEPDLAGYNIWRSENPNDIYGKIKVNNNLITDTYYDDIPPQDTTLYYYCVTAQIKAGTESRLSNEVSGYMGTLDYQTQPLSLYSISPNPFRDVLTFCLPEEVNTQISIYDCKGSILHEINCHGSVQWNPQTSFPAGVYFIRIRTPQQNIFKKVIKLR